MIPMPPWRTARGHLFLALFLGVLAGCSNTPQYVVELPDKPVILRHDEAFGPRPEIPDPQSVFRLEPAQLADFHAWFDDPQRRYMPKQYRVSGYLQNVTQGFSFQGATHTASEAMALNSGNCLSLAILTTALAREAGVDLDYQLMSDDPVYELQGQLVEKGVHVRTRLYDPDWTPPQYTHLIRRPALVVDYFPTGTEIFLANVSPEDFIARYYRNIAADALAAGDFDTAYWNTVVALEQAPGDAESLNTLAVTYRRAGMEDIAETVYRYGIATATEKLSLLKNYHLLLESQGRDSEAAAVERQLETMDDPSPFHWFQLARSAMDAGNYHGAIRYFGKAIERAPYVPDFQAELAKAYYMAGERSKAKQAFRRAIELAYQPKTRTRYEAKLAALTH